MKIILHIGRPKTGTTAIQLSMLRARDVLLKQGILVPSTREFPQFQHFAALICTRPEFFPRYISHGIFAGPEAALAAARRSWEEMLRQIEQTRPKVLFLSSEHFWKHRSREGSRSLVDMLKPLSGDIGIVGYVRNPADHFLSDYQQWARSWGIPLPVRAGIGREVIESFEREFGQEVTLVPFDRAQLYHGDVVQDFVHRFLRPPLPQDIPIPTFAENRSDSAASIAICEEYWRWNHPERPEHNPWDVRALRAAIARVEAETGTYRRPVLKPDLRHQIIRASTELLWLRQTRGITFPGVDYDSIDGKCGDLIGRDDLAVADVMEVDSDLVSQLRARAVASLIGETRKAQRSAASPAGGGRGQGAGGPARKAPWYVRRFRRLKRRGRALIDLTLGSRSGS